MYLESGLLSHEIVLALSRILEFEYSGLVVAARLGV